MRISKAVLVFFDTFAEKIKQLYSTDLTMKDKALLLNNGINYEIGFHSTCSSDTNLLRSIRIVLCNHVALEPMRIVRNTKLADIYECRLLCIRISCDI